jgi:hypothetical protein
VKNHELICTVKQLSLKDGIIAIKSNIIMLQREIITVTDVFEKYNIENIFFYILLLYVKMTF